MINPIESLVTQAEQVDAILSELLPTAENQSESARRKVGIDMIRNAKAITAQILEGVPEEIRTMKLR